MQSRLMALTLATGLALAACGDDGTGITAQDLQGTWEASVYEFTDNADPLSVVDVILRDGASFTLTVDADGNASTLFDNGIGGSSSDSGVLNSDGTILTLAGDPFDAVRNGDRLDLSYATSSFDFGSGSVAATLRIVMNRQ
ncbi:MAG: hypothetical protein HKN73_04615 [Gemmatimonadetes bacterium]|nr:hypothetical protein [Gemmatimonadota bacterium]